MKRPIAPALLVAAALLTLGFRPPVQPAQAAVTALLPDLAVLPPFDFRLEYSSTGRRLLRFSTVIANIGTGPLDLYGYDAGGFASNGDPLHVRQRILQSDGTWRVRDTTARMAWAADGHDHFHVVALQRFKFQTLQGTTLLDAAKTGFCFLDSYPFESTEASRYNSANSVCRVAPNRIVPMGLSVRWGDIYKSTIAFQWIDITGVASGDYLIKIIADPPWNTGGQFLESNESNNRGWARIHLTKNTVTVLSKSARP